MSEITKIHFQDMDAILELQPSGIYIMGVTKVKNKINKQGANYDSLTMKIVIKDKFWEIQGGGHLGFCQPHWIVPGLLKKLQRVNQHSAKSTPIRSLFSVKKKKNAPQNVTL